MDLMKGYSIGGDKNTAPAKRTAASTGAQKAAASANNRFAPKFDDDSQSSTAGDAAGIDNVSLRGSNKGAAIGYSDMERMQASLQKLSASAAPAPLIDQLDDGGDLWRDRQCSEMNECLTRRMFDVPRSNQAATHFKHDPHHYSVDYMEQSDADLRRLNGGTWQEVCFPEDKPRAANEPAQPPRSYHSPFPGQSSALHETDYHVHQSTHHVKLHFMLPDASQTHAEFVKQYRDGKDGSGGDGTVHIKIPKEVIKTQLQSELGSIDWDKTPYHINVFDMNCTFEHSNFLVEFDKVLASASSVEKDKMQSWSASHGVSNAADNMVTMALTQEAAYKKFIYNPIHAGENRGAPMCPSMYIAPPHTNGAEFPRWISRNWKAIADDLTKLQRGNAYEIQLPPSSKFKDFNLITWFIFDEMANVHKLTEEYNEQPSIQLGGKQMEFNKIYSTDATEATAFTLISKRALDTLFREKKERFEQEKLLMNLEAVSLILWPIQGSRGWDVYSKLAKERETFLPAVGERVIYTADVSICFAPYRQALLPSSQGTDFLSSPASSSSSSSSHQSRQASKAHSAIKDSFAEMNGE